MDFSFFRPRKGKRYEDKSRIDPEMGWPKVVYYYRPIICSERTPFKFMPQDVLQDMLGWYLDRYTGEAIMVDENNRKLLKVYDALHLANLSKDDLLRLDTLKVFSWPEMEDEAKKYQNVVTLCVEKMVHAGYTSFETGKDDVLKVHPKDFAKS